MNIKVVHQTVTTRGQVYLHAWDQHGWVRDVLGERTEDGRTFEFTMGSSVQDQREVSFKYRYIDDARAWQTCQTPPEEWERDEFIRTVPTLSATQLWTYECSSRCLTSNPGTIAEFQTVTIHAISRCRFLGGRLHAWDPVTGSVLRSYLKRHPEEDSATTTFIVELNEFCGGFHFKLVSAGGDDEPDAWIRVWRPSDGAEVWIKSGQVDLRPQAISPVDTTIEFVYPTSFSPSELRIKDFVDDFEDKRYPIATTEWTSISVTHAILCRPILRQFIHSGAANRLIRRGAFEFPSMVPAGLRLRSMVTNNGCRKSRK